MFELPFFTQTKHVPCWIKIIDCCFPMPEIGRFTDDLQNGKPSSSRQIEELVDRLERQLAIGGPSCSSDTLINVKNIVTGTNINNE